MKLDWKKTGEHSFRIEDGPFGGATVEYALKQGWLSWRGMTVSLGRHGGIHDAEPVLRKHPSAPKGEVK